MTIPASAARMAQAFNRAQRSPRHSDCSRFLAPKRGLAPAIRGTHNKGCGMKSGSSELTETYQALDDAGGVHIIQVFAEVLSIDRPDGTTERTFGPKTHTTADGHALTVHEDGTLEDLQAGVTMRRIESP